MGLLDSFLEKIFGNVHFYIFVGKKPAAEIIINEKEIVVDIKNPVLAVEAAIEQMLKKKHVGSEKLKQLKKMGYKVKIKYKRIEFYL